MIPADAPIRKACDRCHAQKLSCKRVADEPCERCLRLRVECKSSPSLRYRRHQGSPTSSSLQLVRSPKRKRMVAEGGSLVRGGGLGSLPPSSPRCLCGASN